MMDATHREAYLARIHERRRALFDLVQSRGWFGSHEEAVITLTALGDLGEGSDQLLAILAGRAVADMASAAALIVPGPTRVH